MAQPTPPEFQPNTPKKTASAAHKSKTGQPLPPTGKQVAVAYENNPFTIAASGIDDLFKYAKVLAIVMLTLALVSMFTSVVPSVIDYGNYQSEPTPKPTQDATMLPAFSFEQIVAIIAVFGGIFLVFALVSFVVAAIFNGLRDVAAAAIVKQQSVSFGEAFTILFSRFGGYLWLQALITIKVLLWSLLFVIPGIIMAVRYSLAGTAFFARDMKANEALAHSTSITKGAWLTTVASYGLFNLITLGVISVLVETGARGTLFRQFDAYQTAGLRKPSPHGLTIGYFLLLILFLLFVVGSGVLLAIVVASGFGR